MLGIAMKKGQLTQVPKEKAAGQLLPQNQREVPPLGGDIVERVRRLIAGADAHLLEAGRPDISREGSVAGEISSSEHLLEGSVLTALRVLTDRVCPIVERPETIFPRLKLSVPSWTRDQPGVRICLNQSHISL
jgi:hypothetical protein